MKAKLLGRAMCVASALISFIPSARASVLAYESSFSNFGIVDLTTGQFTFLGNAGQTLAGLGNYGGNLYAGINTGSNFYQVNPGDGSLSFIGNSGTAIVATGSTTAGVYELGFDDNLYSVNLTNGALTLIGNTGIPLNSPVGMSANGPNLYINSQSNLYLMNLTTGAASLVGSTSPTQFGTMVYIDGVYYAGTATDSPYKVVTFDPNTAAVLTSQDSNSGIFWGLAPVVTPLPGALPLFATGLGALGLLGWRRKRKLLPTCFFVVAGCSGGFGTMDRVMRSWEGAPLDAVIAQWGYPDQEQTVAGHKIYRWFYTKTFNVPATTSTTVNTVGRTSYINSTTSGGGTVRGDCVRTLEVDQQNIITKWEWKGNNCPFADILEYSNWERKSR
jgi:hypothetical protein